jgi:hypothetical protein
MLPCAYIGLVHGYKIAKLFHLTSINTVVGTTSYLKRNLTELHTTAPSVNSNLTIMRTQDQNDMIVFIQHAGKFLYTTIVIFCISYHNNKFDKSLSGEKSRLLCPAWAP